MKILNLHGYGSQSENSVCLALKANGYEVVSPQIDYENKSPEEIWNKVLTLYSETSCQAVTGSSMGGFFAVQVASEKKCPAVLMNPCICPFQTLPEFNFENKAFVLEYIKLFSNLEKLDFSKTFAVIGEKDDVIKTHSVIKYLLDENHVILIPDGGHPSSTLPMEEIFRKYGNLFFSN